MEYDVSTSHSGTLRLCGPLEAVFPLFDPINEAKWADGWEITPVYPHSGVVGEGMGFTTPSPHGDDSLIWTLSRLDQADHLIEYQVWFPDSRLQHIRIQCQAAKDDHTQASVRYTLTALSEDGNRVIEQVNKANYAKRMAHWEQAINQYLTTGETLKAH